MTRVKLLELRHEARGDNERSETYCERWNQSVRMGSQHVNAERRVQA
jgi:hypothetical protein